MITMKRYAKDADGVVREEVIQWVPTTEDHPRAVLGSELAATAREPEFASEEFWVAAGMSSSLAPDPTHLDPYSEPLREGLVPSSAASYDEYVASSAKAVEDEIAAHNLAMEEASAKDDKDKAAARAKVAKKMGITVAELESIL